MKNKIIYILLIFLLSISISACSNINSSLMVDNNSILSENKSEDTNIPISSTPTPINTTSDSKNESANTQLSSENNKKLVMEAYKAVLQNKTEFFSTDNKKNLYLNDFLTNQEIYGANFKVMNFSVIDMDGDKIPEVVVELSVNSKVPSLYEVLHYINGKVYGYVRVIRGLGALKMDGTFSYSNSSSNNGYGKLSFQPNGSETDIILGYRKRSNENDPTSEVYYINNKQVTEEAYEAFVKEQSEKKDVEWYEFSQENIQIKLSIGS